MHIQASVRPRGLRRGTTDKKLAKLLGFNEAQGLATICGRLELSASNPQEFYFLKCLYDVFGYGNDKHKNIIIVMKDGKEVIRYGDLELESTQGGKNESAV